MFTIEKLSDLRKAVRYAAPHAAKTDAVPVLSGINFRADTPETRGVTRIT